MSGLDLAGVSVNLGTNCVVSQVTCRLPPSGLVALIGPNGAGKTSLLKAICGLVAHAGTITLDGADLALMERGARARAIAYLPQGHAIHWPLTARDVVALGRYPHGVRDPLHMREADRAVVEKALARADALPFADRPVQQLSGGERARVMLARVLAVEADVLLADEPTAALDPRHQLAIMADLKAEAARGALVLAVTHDLGLAARFADFVVLIDKGRLIASGAPQAVLTRENLADVYGIQAYHTEIAGEPVIVPWSLT